MISLSDISVALKGRSILNGISLVVETGSWTSLIGPNGSGKTTLLRAVAGLIPFSGETLISGSKLEARSRKQQSRVVAYVPQKPSFPPGMSVQDYVLLGRTPYIPYLGTENHHDLAIVAQLLEELSLERHAPRRLDSLSGGELQRAILARALAQEAQVLLLDEPTTAMDIGHQQQILELIDSLRAERGLTVLSALHDLTLAGQFPDRLFLLNEGRVWVSGPPRSVLTEEVLFEHYGAAVKILEDPLGGIAVVPLRGTGKRQDHGARTGLNYR